mgnify:CR=1 FL=1
MVFITAEIGINHNGDIENAKKLIDLSKVAGCNAVKFQKRTIDKVYTKEQLDSARESPWGITQREQKEGLEFGLNEYQEIDRYCKEKNIKIALSLAEGFPRQPEDIIFSIGKPEFIKLIDLILPWGRILANSCRDSTFTDNATISETGSPRFDY